MDFTKPEIKVETTKLREKLGKCGDDILEATAKLYGWKVPGKLDALKDCAIRRPSKRKLTQVGLKESILLVRSNTLILP